MERKEAIEVIKKNWPDNNFTMLCEALETLIPELKESGDERIRKFLHHTFTVQYLAKDELGKWHGEPVSNILAWLEKQGEQTDINPSEFDSRLNKLLKQFETLSKEELASSLSFYLNVVQNDGTYKAEEKQDEQKPYGQRKECEDCQFSYVGECKGDCALKRNEQKSADKIEDEEYNGEDYGIDSLYHAQRILEKTLGKVDGYQTDDGILAHQCAITAIKKLYEQKPAEWSEEDEKMRNNLIRLLIRLSACTHTNSTSPSYSYPCEIDWLKSLKPQNKCVYNPYKAVVESIAEMCKHYDIASHSALRDFYQNVKVKCKDAKEYDSMFPQNTWKPSDEQMEALANALSLAKNCGEENAFDLRTLYEQLKKL